MPFARNIQKIPSTHSGLRAFLSGVGLKAVYDDVELSRLLAAKSQEIRNTKEIKETGSPI